MDFSPPVAQTTSDIHVKTIQEATSSVRDILLRKAIKETGQEMNGRNGGFISSFGMPNLIG